MVGSEVKVGIEEIRTGRHLFVRQTLIGNTKADDQVQTFQFLFVHGICGSESQYHLLLQCIERQISNADVNIQATCILYDAIGCGQSPKLDEWNAYNKDEAILDLKELIDKYCIDKSTPTVLVGHSYGPSIFLSLLGRCINTDGMLPINLVGCIFLGTSIRGSENPVKDGGHLMFRLPVTILNLFQPTMTKSFVENGIDPAHKELRKQVEQASNTNNMFVAKAYYRQSIWATVDDLVAVKDIPALIIHGATDKLLPDTCGRHLSTLLPKSEFVVLHEASHLVMMEQPEKVAKACVTFLQKLIP